MISSDKFLACALSVMLAWGTLVGVADAQTVDQARTNDVIRQALERYAREVQSPASPPGQSASPTQPGVVALGLDDAVKLALDHNLDIAVQRLNPQTFDFSIASLRSVYRPTLTSQLATQSNVNAPTTTIVGVPAGAKGVTQSLSLYNGGISQSLPWGGGGVTVTLNNNRQATTSTTALYNPTFNTNYSVLYTQPLLRGLRIDSTRQQLVVTKLNQEISELQLQATITNTLSNVRNAYWDYVYAVQAVEVAQQSVNLATKLVGDNQTRVEVGTMAPIDVVQAQSQAAIQRQNLVLAQGTRRTAELALKRLIVSGTEDPNWRVTLNPVDRPDFRSEPIDVEAAIRRALSARTDIEQAKKNVQVNNETLKYLKNQGLPQADVVARYGYVGVGGTQFQRAGTGIGGQIVNTIPGGFGNALTTLFGRDYPTWNVTVNVSYPLGGSAAGAALGRATIQLNQTAAQLRQIELQVATDVTNAATQVQSAIESAQAAQAAHELALRQLEAEQSKFEVGMSTNYVVIQAQRDLAASQNAELRAVLNYRKSLVELDRLQQTTLQNLNITVLSTSGLAGSAVGSGR